MGEKIEVSLCLKEKFQTKGDVILGHAPNEGLLHSDPPACIMELCQVTAICVITQLFDFFIACLTDTVAPVVVGGCQQNSH